MPLPKAKELDPEELHRLFYEKDGILYRKIDRATNVLKDTEAGHVNSKGYKHTRIGDKKYSVHRILYVMYTNAPIPEGLLIDHIDGDKLNNRKENLRLVTPQENSYNNKKAKGYRYLKKSKKFCAYIYVKNKLLHLGTYNTELDARAAYLRAKEKHHRIEER